MKTFLQSAKRTVSDNGTAFGYSLVIAGSFTVLGGIQGFPTRGEIMLAVFGTTILFSLLQVLNQFVFVGTGEEENKQVIQIGNSLNFVSVPGAVGVVMLLEVYIRDTTIMWLIAPVVATVVYLILTSFEIAVIRRVLDRWKGR